MEGKTVRVAGYEEECRVESCSKKKTVLCLAVLAALNLGVLWFASQVPLPYLNFDTMVDRVLGQEGRQESQDSAVITVSPSEIHFRSCAGGESPYCHKTSNKAVL